MKRLCMTCMSVDEADLFTCPLCGEASWRAADESPAAPAVEESAPADDQPVAEEAVVEEATPAKKKSKK